MFFGDEGTMMASGSCRDDKSTFENESALEDGDGIDFCSAVYFKILATGPFEEKENQR